MIVAGPLELLWSFVNDRVGTPLSSDLKCVGLVHGGCIVAVAAYNAWVGHTCCFHGAIDNPEAIDRTFIRAIFSYPFEQCGVTHMFALVSEKNDKSLKFCFKSGFKQVNRSRGAGLEGEDMLLLSLTPDECRWLRRTDSGKERHPRSAGLHRGSERAGRGVQRIEHGSNVGQPPHDQHSVGIADLEYQFSD